MPKVLTTWAWSGDECNTRAADCRAARVYDGSRRRRLCATCPLDDGEAAQAGGVGEGRGLADPAPGAEGLEVAASRARLPRAASAADPRSPSRGRPGTRPGCGPPSAGDPRQLVDRDLARHVLGAGRLERMAAPAVTPIGAHPLGPRPTRERRVSRRRSRRRRPGRGAARRRPPRPTPAAWCWSGNARADAPPSGARSSASAARSAGAGTSTSRRRPSSMPTRTSSPAVGAPLEEMEGQVVEQLVGEDHAVDGQGRQLGERGHQRALAGPGPGLSSSSGWSAGAEDEGGFLQRAVERAARPAAPETARR